MQKPGPALVVMLKGDGFAQRGSTGAAYYVIERAEKPSGSWVMLAAGLEDSVMGLLIIQPASFQGLPGDVKHHPYAT